MTHDAAAPALLDHVRPEVRALPLSGIVEVFDYGRNRQGLIPLWVGEGDLPTPAFICDAAAASLAAGETFYTYQAGIPELRSAIADYMAEHYGRPFPGGRFGPERFFATVGGMHALQIAVRITAGTGDEVLVPTPAWPNFAGALVAAGAAPVECPMRLEGEADHGRWRIAVEDLERALTPRTRVLVVNSPSNPTGWVATREELEELLGFARAHGLWIIADEIYGRFFHGDAPRAPSFHDVMRADDRVLFVQTFSKNWAMTGWRIGWLEAPPELGPAIENLVQYSTSGVPVATQRAAAVAIRGGEGLIRAQVDRARTNRDLLAAALRGTGRLRCALPDGAFYLFCGFDGVSDSRALALRLVDEAGIGVAPGSAFGAVGQGFVRLCYARRTADVDEVARRITAWLAR
ncbi:pyridoxal phosphate-dependent aminotransferase [Lichenibacterium dinghuense]|uniref:pyridoxal phosphate-dependent aminotransferase n=1 Tax=Lichenibacterium dinghuense TaxID=2895977 RepID=UPI001F3D5CEB|nr:pyridoxal phosphate-dependent aminotransferase [Lichenibacterium sp. 6Y81]